MKKKSHFKSKYIMYLLILILIMSFAIPLTSWYMAVISAVICFISTILIVALWEGVYSRLAELESENKDLQYLCNKIYDDLTKEIDRLEEENTEQLKQFAEMLKRKTIRRQEFIGELAIDDIEYVKTQDIDKTLNDFLKRMHDNENFN